jgi:AhpC/TSA family
MRVTIAQIAKGVVIMIRKVLCVVFLLAAASLAAAQTTPPAPTTTPTPAKPAAPSAPHTNLKVGDKAPDFTLPSTIVGDDKRSVRYKLSDFQGKKNVVLAFYVFAFTGG